MPAAIDEIIRRNVIRQWISGEPRDKIAREQHRSRYLKCGRGKKTRTEFSNSIDTFPESCVVYND